MKKKGFTLIELLAVIVVLAIIALIATPIVMNVIKNAQKGATERSAERYVDAVETAITTDRLENGQIADGIYTVDADGNLVLGDKTLTVEVSGDRPTAGSKVAIENGQVVATGTNMTIGDYTVTINDKGSATATTKGDVVALCNAIAPTVQGIWNPDYFDEETFEVGAMESKTVGVQATSEAPYAAGAVYACDLGDGVRTFYVLKEDGNNVKLIMSDNISSQLTLENVANDWIKLTNAGGTVELPKAQDIAAAMGDTEWTDNNLTGTVGPDWMRVNLDGTDLHLGYRTSTSVSDNSNSIWYMGVYGSLQQANVNDTVIRPVITISKSSLSL